MKKLFTKTFVKYSSISLNRPRQFIGMLFYLLIVFPSNFELFYCVKFFERFIFSDVQTLSSTSPAVSYEWSTLIRSHCSKEPEALWNLLSIVREMLKRGDGNASILLHAITDECLSIDFILIRWYYISLTKSGKWTTTNGTRNNAQFITRQYNACSLCDEIVSLWRVVTLNPRLSVFERDQVGILIIIVTLVSNLYILAHWYLIFV